MPVDRRRPLEQGREVAAGVVWRLVVIDDLPEQLDFARTRCDRLTRVGHDLGNRTHPLVPARVRHHAERAELVAPLDDCHVRPAGRPRRAIPSGNDTSSWARYRPAVSAAEPRWPRSTSIGSRRMFCVPMTTSTADGSAENAVAFLLRDAAGDGNDRTRPFVLGPLTDLAQAGEQLLLRPLPHAAGVDDDDVGIPVVRVAS